MPDYRDEYNNNLPFGPPWGLGHGGLPAVAPPTDTIEGAPIVSSLTQQIYLPQTFPIPDAKEFNVGGSQATAAAAVNQQIPFTPSGGVDATGSFVVPPNTFGIIRSVVFDITNMLTTTSVDFSVTINGAPVQGYAQIQIFPRVAPFVGNSFDSAIYFTGPAVIQVRFDNNDGGAYVVGASIGGWYWPQASDARWRQLGR